ASTTRTPADEAPWPGNGSRGDTAAPVSSEELLTAVYFFLSSYLFSFYKLAMASKLNPNVLYVAGPGESLGSPQADSERTHITGEAGEESSDSEGEQEETSHKLIRKVSTSGQIRAK
ncbi:hypothetical protein XENORESO_011781, partial [Xenotaenia resolanae]